MPRSSPKFLRRDVALRMGPHGPQMHRGDASVVHRLELHEAIALALLGQFGDADAAIEHLAQAIDLETARERVAAVVARWSPYLGDAPARPVTRDWLNALRTPGVAEFRRTREAAPAAISWVVTLTCNRRCPYCYYKVLPWDGTQATGPADATLPWTDIARVIDEMALLGTSALYLTGGEPLLRPDLPRIVQRAAEHGIRVLLNTKYAVDRELARALAAGQMCDVSYSLDAADPKTADGLAGHKGYLGEAIDAITELLAAGVALRVNAVATSPSAPRLRELALLCISLGVPELTISPYMEPSFARSSHVKLIRFGPPLPVLVARLQQELGSAIKLNVGSAEAAASGEPIDCSDRLLCEVGIQTLDLLPDGRVTRCRYSPHDEELIVGDVRSQSLLEVWQGRPLLDLTFPPAERFGDTACATCSGLQQCNTRGRCVVGAKSSHGRVHAPDAGCHRVPA